jgi:tyrosyl-tRNA synthetase
MGHSIPLKKLSEMQALGHKIILLIGDFTAMIGDPTDKSAVRKQLTREEVLENCKLYKKQAEKFLKFDGENPAELKFNSTWLAPLSFSDIVDLASHFTVQQMVERDMFEKRIKENKPVYLHEFLYPLMQGYDSVAMDVDAEIGGNDQLFNMMAGRNLLHDLKGKDKFVLMVKLLADTNGKKMGKTEGNIVSFLDNEFEVFGKIMSWTDAMIVSGFELVAFADKEEIDIVKKELEEGVNPRDIKIRLAKKVVELYHNKEAADRAEQNFIETFSKGGVSDDALEIFVKEDLILADVIVENKITESKSEYRRLVKEGAVSDTESGQKISDPNFVIKKDLVVKVGKRRFLKIKIKK